MNWQEFLQRNGDELMRNSPYEVLFVERVLSKVPGIDFRHVGIQTKFTDEQGRQRRIDFTLVEGARIRLAIEVDGYNKDGVSPGMTHPQFIDWQRRERSIVQHGWRLLRFANAEMFDDPRSCARAIELTLNLLRAESRGLAKPVASGELEGLLKKQGEAVRRFEQQLGAAVKGGIPAQQVAELGRVARRVSDDAAYQADAALRTLGRENRSLKIAVASVVVVVLAALGTVAFVVTRPPSIPAGGSGGSENTPSAPHQQPPTRTLPQQALPTRPQVNRPQEQETTTQRVRIVNLVSSVVVGKDITLTAQAQPNTTCSVAYFTPSGNPSSAAGLTPKLTSSSGTVTWK